MATPEDVRFIKKVLELDLLNREQLKHCLELQKKQAEQGKHSPIWVWLQEEGMLQWAEVEIVHRQCQGIVGNERDPTLVADQETIMSSVAASKDGRVSSTDERPSARVVSSSSRQPAPIKPKKRTIKAKQEQNNKSSKRSLVGTLPRQKWLWLFFCSLLLGGGFYLFLPIDERRYPENLPSKAERRATVSEKRTASSVVEEKYKAEDQSRSSQTQEAQQVYERLLAGIPDSEPFLVWQALQKFPAEHSDTATGRLVSQRSRSIEQIIHANMLNALNRFQSNGQYGNLASPFWQTFHEHYAIVKSMSKQGEFEDVFNKLATIYKSLHNPHIEQSLDPIHRQNITEFVENLPFAIRRHLFAAIGKHLQRLLAKSNDRQLREAEEKIRGIDDLQTAFLQNIKEYHAKKQEISFETITNQSFRGYVESVVDRQFTLRSANGKLHNLHCYEIKGVSIHQLFHKKRHSPQTLYGLGTLLFFENQLAMAQKYLDTAAQQGHAFAAKLLKEVKELETLTKGLKIDIRGNHELLEKTVVEHVLVIYNNNDLPLENVVVKIQVPQKIAHIAHKGEDPYLWRMAILPPKTSNERAFSLLGKAIGHFEYEVLLVRQGLPLQSKRKYVKVYRR